MIDCRKCEHYHVTWDRDFPHGCRAMGFKSKHLPNIDVRNSTPGMDCLLFQKKDRAGQAHDRKG